MYSIFVFLAFFELYINNIGVQMAVFRFSLQQVLEYREQLCDQAQIELAKIVAAILGLEKTIDNTNQAIQAQKQSISKIDLNNVGERWLTENFIKSLQEDLSVMLGKLHELHQAQEEAKKTVARLAKEHKVLEKLKDKQAERHVQKERHKEQQIYDETASIRFNTKAL